MKNRTRVLLVIAGACVVAAIAALLGSPTSARAWTAASAAIVAALGVGGALLTERAKVALEQQDELTRQVAKTVLRRGEHIPLVRESMVDPLALGVLPAGLGESTPVPPYVPRDIDKELREKLRSSGFTLLVGEACAGKTRAAFEAMRDVLPDHLLLVPSAEREVAAVVEKARSSANCVLWLDNLPAFLREGRITRNDISGLLAGSSHHRVVLATMRTRDEIRLTGGSAGDAQLLGAGQGVLDLARHRRIFLKRLFTRAELARAKQIAAADERITAALEHTDRVGVAEYLAWGPELFTQWEDAWDPGIEPRGAALIAAAVDCRLAGFTGPLPRRLLTALHGAYLSSALTPGDIDAAWEWALALQNGGSAPLQLITEDTCDVFGYLVDEHRRRHGEVAPERAARAALAEAGPADANGIAMAAWRHGHERLASDALRRQYDQVSTVTVLDDPVRIVLRVNLAVMALRMNGYQAGVAEAEREFREILTQVDGQPTADPDFVATVRGKLGNALFAQGRLPESEVEYRAVIAMRTTVLGDEHPRTLISRNNLALVLAEMNRLEEAEAELRAVVAIRRTLGPDHPDTKDAENNLATVLRRKARR